MSGGALAGVVLVAAGLLLGALLLLWPKRASAVPVHVPLEATGLSRRQARPDLFTRMSAMAARAVERDGRADRIKASLEQAGMTMAPGDWVLLVTGGVVVAFLLGALLLGIVGAVLAAVLAWGALRVVRTVRASRRQTRFAEQLGDTLMLLSSSLRSGYGLLQAVDSVAREADAPTSEEFARVVIETRLGRSVSDALGGVAERVRNEDFEWVVEAITINREVGGELSDVLSRVAETIRQRERLRRQVRALSAEGRISALFLTALPIVLFLYMRITNPEYVGLLTSSPIGWVMLVVAIGLLVAGGLWMRMLIRVRY